MLSSPTPVVWGSFVLPSGTQCCTCGHLGGLYLHYIRNAQCENWGHREEVYAKGAHVGGEAAGRG